MGSFRKRLLVLIIGLVIVTQTVTLAAVLVSMRRTVEARAAEQLRAGGTLAENLIAYRGDQLASGVAVLAADFGFREAVASGHAPTILSAAKNNAPVAYIGSGDPGTKVTFSDGRELDFKDKSATAAAQ